VAVLSNLYRFKIFHWKIAVSWLLNIPPLPAYVATLPFETLIFSHIQLIYCDLPPGFRGYDRKRYINVIVIIIINVRKTSD